MAAAGPEVVADFESVFIELPLDVLLPFECFLARPITSILSARFEAGSKLARTWVPSRIAEMPAATGCPRRSTCVCESTVSVTPPADWSRVMLFWSTRATEPVTVRRLPWSEEVSVVLPGPVLPYAPELWLPLSPLWP